MENVSWKDIKKTNEEILNAVREKTIRCDNEEKEEMH